MVNTIEDAMTRLRTAKNELVQIRDLRELTDDSRYYLKKVIDSTEAFLYQLKDEKDRKLYRQREEFRQNLVINIDRVSTVLEHLVRPEDFFWRWQAVHALEYSFTPREKLFAAVKTGILVIAAAVIGFVVSTVGTLAITGGIASIPGGIISGLKAAIAAIGAGTATIALSPIVASLGIARDTLVQRTNSPIEKSLLKMKRAMIDYSVDDLEENAGRIENASVKKLLQDVLRQSNSLKVASYEGGFLADKSGMRRKCAALREAVAAVLDHGRLNYLNRSDVLDINVEISGKNMKFRDVIGIRRHPLYDGCAGFFCCKKRWTDTEKAVELDRDDDDELQSEPLSVYTLG